MDAQRAATSVCRSSALISGHILQCVQQNVSDYSHTYDQAPLQLFIGAPEIYHIRKLVVMRRFFSLRVVPNIHRIIIHTNRPITAFSNFCYALIKVDVTLLRRQSKYKYWAHIICMCRLPLIMIVLHYNILNLQFNLVTSLLQVKFSYHVIQAWITRRSGLKSYIFIEVLNLIFLQNLSSCKSMVKKKVHEGKVWFCKELKCLLWMAHIPLWLFQLLSKFEYHA